MSAPTFRTTRNRKSHNAGGKRFAPTSNNPAHGHGATALSWLGAGLFILGIVLTAVSGIGVSFWVLGGLAVQLWIVAALMRPIEAIWSLLEERLPKS